MNRIAQTLAPLVAMIAAAVACTALSLALLGPAPAQAQGVDPITADLGRAS